MAVRIGSPRRDFDGLRDLEPLWLELHQHHLEVSEYENLVVDPDISWARRRDWYRRLLAAGGVYLTAVDDRSCLTGYVMIGVEDGPDDTFDVKGGVAEVVTLVVTRGLRSTGVGRALLSAAEDFARSRGLDTVKIAVMRGNARARRFYEANGYSVGEEVLYRDLGDDRSFESD
jgi:ribosomal protein S18 acetylase RimI-like enzyme